MTLDIPVLETERLILREPQMTDFPHWHAFVQSDRAIYVGGKEYAPLGAAWRAFGHLAGMWMLRGYGNFIFADKNAPDTPLGMAGPWHPMDWPEKELGWSVWSTEAEGKGIALEAATEARRYAYDVLNWDGAVSYIAAANERSIALAKRLGCVEDPAAPRPDFGENVLVYRHPGPGAVA